LKPAIAYIVYTVVVRNDKKTTEQQESNVETEKLAGK
jgi:hypothetical protein